jgi:hypothetical protein
MVSAVKICDMLLLCVEGYPGIPPLVTDAFTVVTTRAR